jgi:hypothetical protein
MNTVIATDHLYLAERRIDDTGRGWAFARLTLPEALVSAYVDSLWLWERECAKGYNALIDMWKITMPNRRRFVEGHAFDRSVATMATVRLTVTELYAATDAIKEYVLEHGVPGYGIPLDECDFAGLADFKSRYWPLILAADEANDNHWHEDYFVANNYTSIFNGR